ncbi:MAG: type IV pilus twitching motility protein PilT [Demequina sp.]
MSENPQQVFTTEANGQVNRAQSFMPEQSAAEQSPAPPPPPTQAQGTPAAGLPPQSAAEDGERQSAPAPRQAEPPARQATPPQGRIGMTNAVRDGDIDLNEVLRAMLRVGGSDLHLTVGAPPMTRIDGALVPLDNYPIQKPDSLQRVLYAVMSQKQREAFESELELDFAYALVGESRFRVNMYMQRDSMGAAFRVIPYEIIPLEQLGVPPVVGNFAGLPRGLVLVTGPTGSGKSTTLASIIDLANRNRSDHIMTVEDPIEFLHRHKKSLVNQREVGADTHSFGAALKHVLRQDPDIILVGELRDLETISVALTAAETGHLVFATLHTQDASQTVERIIDVFPAHQQGQVRAQLATALQGVVCQTLCRRSDGPGRAVATEVMLATSAIRNLIREGKTHQIYSSMQAGAKQGMHTIDQHLADLVRIGRISYESGLEKCHHVEEFNRLSGQAGGGHAQGSQSAHSGL